MYFNTEQSPEVQLLMCDDLWSIFSWDGFVMLKKVKTTWLWPTELYVFVL